MTSDCPVLTVFELLKKRFRVENLESFHCLAPRDFSKQWLLKNYTAKLESKETSKLQEITTENWRIAEKQCFSTNQRLNKVTDCPYFSAVRSLIESVIGLGPSAKLADQGRWSNGATANTRRGLHYSLKLKGPILVTSAAAPLIPYYFHGMSQYGLGAFEVTRSNRCVQVPKNARTNRMIAAEPAANAFMQQSVGRFIRSRLLTRAGIDLRDQKINQNGAFEAYVDGLSTIDLQMASDTMSKSLVSHVLPHDWYLFLSSLRCEFSEVSGKTVYLEKFSSMGNAFTFELESLIFWALMKALTGDSAVLVYGDDIIIERQYYDVAVKALSYAGFIVNSEKSFKEGPFFESCGKHYYELEDVTPVYQKENLVHRPTTLDDVLGYYRAHNRLARWGLRNGMHLVKDACLSLIKRVPREFQLFIPMCERDDGFISSTYAHRVDLNGDFRCKVIHRKEGYKNRLDQTLCFAEKLRNPSLSNERPNGHPASIGDAKLSIKTVTIWSTQLY